MEYYFAMRKNEILTFTATWMELEGIMLSEISQSEKDIVCFHSYVELEKLNRRPWGKGRGKIVSNREGCKLYDSSIQRTEGRWGSGGGERGKWVMGIEEGTFWDEHWVLYGSDES